METADTKENNWEPLLYRIGFKLPFLKVDAGEPENLSSLFDDNQQEIMDKKPDLVNFHNKLFAAVEKHVDIGEIPAEELLEKLMGMQNVD